MTVTDLLRERNRIYSSTLARAELPVTPNLRLAVLACMDARMDVPRLLGMQLGDAHIIRNAGGVASDDAIRSLAVSQWVADTREIVLLHHTDCGMTKFRDEELAERIEAETGRRPSMPLMAFADEMEDLRASVRLVRESPLLRYPDLVRGFLYDVGTGSMEEAS